MKLTWIIVGIVLVAIFLVIVTDAGAARPSQHTAVVRADYAVDQLCGPVCMRRDPPDIFYNCGPNAKCWNMCFTHVERKWYSFQVKHKCSTGKIMYRSGYLTYYFEY